MAATPDDLFRRLDELGIAPDDLIAFIRARGHEPRIVDFDAEA